MRKIADGACPGLPGTFSTPPQGSDPDMHDARAVMHAGILISGFFEVSGGEIGPDISGACASCNFTYLVRGQRDRVSYTLAMVTAPCCLYFI